jgi:hypothetical protein
VAAWRRGATSTKARRLPSQHEGVVAALAEGSGDECGVRRGGASDGQEDEDEDDAWHLGAAGGQG